MEARRLNRWEERESLRDDLVETAPFVAESWQVAFNHAGVSRMTTIRVGWLEVVRLPGTHQRLWAVVAEECDDLAAEREEEGAVRTLVLLSDVAVANTDDARALFSRLATRGTNRARLSLLPGGGLLDVEDMRVRSLERMRRLFILVLLLAMRFVMHPMERWPKEAVRWLRQLGGGLGVCGSSGMGRTCC